MGPRPVIVLAALALGVLAGGHDQAHTAAAPENPLPGLQTSPPPWPPELAHLAARLDKIGLPRLPEEGTTLHTHQHLDVFVGGRRVVVPAGIGIDAQQRFIAPIHTHDASGIIHVESPTVREFTLGEFFDVWGVRFDARRLGGYCEDGRRAIRVYANGRPVAGDPRALALTPHEQIVVTCGTPDELPRPIPGAYAFPEGL